MMKYIILAILLLSEILIFAQDNNKIQAQEEVYNVFSCGQFKKHFFITTNSGILSTPLGIKIGYGCKTGFYIGTRLGTGEIYHSDSDYTTSKKTTFSITGGLTRALIINKKFSLSFQLGGGYGTWWDFRWERWTSEGYEIEAGFLISYNHIITTITFNILDGYKAYATHDLSLGVGYRF